MDHIDKKAFVFGSIFTLANRLQILGDKFDPNLTIKQWLLLAGIAESIKSTPSLSEVAELIGNSRQNVKKMALILEREGFIQLKKDSEDARILHLELTEKCKEYFINREKRETEFLEQVYQGFDADLLDGLYAGLLKMEDNIKGMEQINENEEKE
ncbi:MarR family winged helix-turn-helix transcriptional regulator [Anaerocolumna sp. MB42-C2]|uniref:MarR family winged helix-turn-helix transcriptional regulator n=1 Tax=Anaerocolumna sp. MB42-C2 TaxID=3070997 RepID=UPI0027DFC6CB|nr:MarR family transcriptional regulator [Anaerocolumna sp. MB42-C2]WMJ88742.1 MarR family transcriptional regulator [Anaerocolumna sp. MB42-C2]